MMLPPLAWFSRSMFKACVKDFLKSEPSSSDIQILQDWAPEVSNILMPGLVRPRVDKVCMSIQMFFPTCSNVVGI
jgi:hypothetical protein